MEFYLKLSGKLGCLEIFVSESRQKRQKLARMDVNGLTAGC